MSQLDGGASVSGRASDGFTFTRRPTSVPPDIRPEWRLPLLLLMVQSCRNQTASREQLHVLNSALLSTGSRRALLAALEGRLAPRSPALQLEPAFDRAIDRALGLGLVATNARGRITLTELGQSIVGAVDSNEELFSMERELLGSLPPSLTQTAVHKALAQRRVS